MTTFDETLASLEFEKADIYKKASLVLSSLDKSDQEWVLENLPQHQSEKLQQLVDELSALGLIRDDKLIKAILNENHIHHFNGERDFSTEYSDVLKRVDAYSIKQVEDILSGEPAYSIAMILSVTNWSWATEYLTGLPDDMADDVRKRIKNYVGQITHSVKVSIIQYLDAFSAVETGDERVGHSL